MFQLLRATLTRPFALKHPSPIVTRVLDHTGFREFRLWHIIAALLHGVLMCIVFLAFLALPSEGIGNDLVAATLVSGTVLLCGPATLRTVRRLLLLGRPLTVADVYVLASVNTLSLLLGWAIWVVASFISGVLSLWLYT